MMYNIQLLELLTNSTYRSIDDNGLPFKPSHNVYREISQEMETLGSSYSPKHVYQILKDNRGEMHDSVLRAFNIIASQASKFEVSLDFSLSEGKSALPEPERKFNLVIPNHVWQDLLLKQ